METDKNWKLGKNDLMGLESLNRELYLATSENSTISTTVGLLTADDKLTILALGYIGIVIKFGVPWQ